MLCDWALVFSELLVSEFGTDTTVKASFWALLGPFFCRTKVSKTFYVELLSLGSALTYLQCPDQFLVLNTASSWGAAD